MNYEKIIVELMSRIQDLEEKVEYLMTKEKNDQGETKTMTNLTTKEIREYIEQIKANAKAAGKEYIILKAGEIHKELNLKNANAPVCDAMRQCFNKNTDIVLYEPEKKKSSAVEIKYYL